MLHPSQPPHLSALHSILARLLLIAQALGALQFLSNPFGDAVQRARLSGDVALSRARARPQIMSLKMRTRASLS